MSDVATWTAAYPRAEGPWTVLRGNLWGRLDPDTGDVVDVRPTADEKLPGLAPALAQGCLMSYRIGRRAVVAGPDRFVKVLRPKRVAALVERHALLSEQTTPFRVPEVLDASEDGRVTLGVVSGISLHRSLRSGPALPVDAIGELVASLHDQPVPGRLPPIEPDDPAGWVGISRRIPTAHLPEIERVADGLPTLAARPEVMVHGDLHDKNIFIGGDTARNGLIDLDGLGRGAAEDDIANLAVHLELRNLQGRTGCVPGARTNRLYRAYRRLRPLDERRLRTVEAHTWFRLACLYQYRAGSAHLVPEFLRAASTSQRENHGHFRPPERTSADL